MVVNRQRKRMPVALQRNQSGVVDWARDAVSRYARQGEKSNPEDKQGKSETHSKRRIRHPKSFQDFRWLGIPLPSLSVP
jgi:hypothetical protein